MSNEDKDKDFVKNLFANIESNVMKNQLKEARQSSKEVVRKFMEQGFDDEEVLAIFIGSLKITPQYNPAMEEFFLLQIKRSIKEVRKENKRSEVDG
jgi:hypothetical protein